MKKYSFYSVLVIFGVLFGWCISNYFSKTEPTENIQKVHNHSIKKENQRWTCSMHPQIMSKEPGNCPICGMDLIPAKATENGLNPNQFKLNKNALALANVETTIIGKKISESEENEELILSGKIQENEKNKAIQVSHFSGRIEKLNVNFVGETVKKGQLLATVYSPELVATQQELITISSLKDEQPQLYKAVKKKLSLWKLSNSQIQEIEKSGKTKTNFPVYSGISGVISELMIERGDYVNRGQGLFKIDNLNSLWCVFDVYENQLGKIKKGQTIKVEANAYPSETFNAKITFIYPTLDVATRTVKVRANITNSGNKLKPGMFVEGMIKAENTNNNGKYIPKSAILWTGKRSVVYIKSNPEKPIFEMKEIVLGASNGKQYEVIQGLNDGDEVVTNGVFTIDAVAELQGKKSMMNQEDENIEKHK